jgi:hypothetical protein
MLTDEYNVRLEHYSASDSEPDGNLLSLIIAIQSKNHKTPKFLKVKNKDNILEVICSVCEIEQSSD